jgi:hypothetical protein
MPIEIKELVIKTTIGGNEQGGRDTSADTTSGSVDMAAIVRVCVEQVMEKLKEKRER